MKGAIYHPILSPDLTDKFLIQKNILKNNVKLFEIRGDRSSGKTDLMIKSFLFDFNRDISNSNFVTTIVSPNNRISEYFRTSIRNELLHFYSENSSEIKSLESIIKNRVVTLSELQRGDRLNSMEIKNLYIDPADFMTIFEIFNLVETCVERYVENIYFFRNN